MPVDRFTDPKGVEHVRARKAGPFIKDPRNLTRDAEALRMRAEDGATYPEIVAALGMKNPIDAQRAVKRAIDQRWPRSQEHADAVRAEENRKLDEAERKVWDVLDDPPFSYGSSGKVVIHPLTGEPQRDGSAVLRAVGQLVNISRRRAAMNGIDIPVEQRASLHVTTDIDREIGGYLATLSAAGRNDAIVASLIETFAETARPRALAASPGVQWSPAADAGGQGEADG